ncbi:hypothetical protein H0H93_012047 [Arthromyces matolae]|nr:hypothetical protein H0H93_012047 [Arthromyces matolae]
MGGPYPSLKELSLGRIIIESGDLLAILNACPLLEILGLYLDLPPKSLLESLTLQDAQIRPPLWVKHLKLFMFGVNTPDVEHNPMVDVIASAFGDLIVSWITSPEPPDQTLEFSIDMYDDSIPMSGKSFPATEDKVRDIINNVIKREVPSKDLDPELHIEITTSFIDMYSIFSMGNGMLDNW